MLVVLQILILFFKIFHPFYVSTAEIHFNTDQKRLEIANKVFLEDIEKAINAKYAIKIDFSQADEKHKIDSLMANYLKNHVFIGVDGKIKTQQYLGYEIDKDVVWFYQEITDVKSIKNLTIKYDLLFDEHPQQSNIVHFSYKGERQSTELINPKAIAVFSVK